MARPKSDTPKYCLHRRSGRGYVTLNGKQITLPGAHNSDESRAAFDRAVADYLNNGRTVPVEPIAAGPTVAMIVLAFWKHAQAYYVDSNGKPTGEAENYKLALRPLRRLYGAEPAADFGPKKLKALRTSMLQPMTSTDSVTGETSTRPGWSRT